MENKTIFKRLQEIKAQLSATKLTKSGKNTYSGYSYFELSDFLPTLIKLCNDNGVYTQVSFTNDMAILTAINVDNPQERVEVTSPMREAEVKGAVSIQQLGAVQTYERRYLYMAMFDIVDNDVCDAVQGKSEQSYAKQTNNAVSAQNVPNLRPQGQFKAATQAQLSYAQKLGMQVEPNRQYSYDEVNSFIKSHQNQQRYQQYSVPTMNMNVQDEADAVADAYDQQ